MARWLILRQGEQQAVFNPEPYLEAPNLHGYRGFTLAEVGYVTECSRIIRHLVKGLLLALGIGDPKLGGRDILEGAVTSTPKFQTALCHVPAWTEHKIQGTEIGLQLAQLTAFHLPGFEIQVIPGDLFSDLPMQVARFRWKVQQSCDKKGQAECKGDQAALAASATLGGLAPERLILQLPQFS